MARLKFQWFNQNRLQKYPRAKHPQVRPFPSRRSKARTPLRSSSTTESASAPSAERRILDQTGRPRADDALGRFVHFDSDQVHPQNAKSSLLTMSDELEKDAALGVFGSHRSIGFHFKTRSWYLFGLPRERTTFAEAVRAGGKLSDESRAHTVLSPASSAPPPLVRRRKVMKSW